MTNGAFIRVPVVLVAENGRTQHIRSIKDAAIFLGVEKKNRVRDAIEKGYPVKGYRIMREDDWSPIADYSFRPSKMRDDDGILTDDGRRNARQKQEKSLTDEQKRQRVERCRVWSKEMAHDPNSKWGKGLNKKAIHCVTNNTDYESLRAAGKALGFTSSQISMAMKKNRPTHGYRFYSKEIWDSVQQKSVLLK